MVYFFTDGCGAYGPCGSLEELARLVCECPGDTAEGVVYECGEGREAELRAELVYRATVADD